MRRERDFDTGKYIYRCENVKNMDLNQEMREEIKQETPKHEKTNTKENEKIVEEIRMPEIAGDKTLKF